MKAREVVFDTNVLVAAFRSKRGASHELVRLIGTAELRLNVSVALALEYEEVLKRDGILQGVPERAIDDFFDYLFQTSYLAPFVLRRRPTLPDPDDERILEVAVQCGATIITHNIKDFAGAEKLGVPVRTPADFLKTIKDGI
ncbi:MAG TPA: putative toxin-antitoxin system toxin component, PIN family [Bryobacteraceae bacterium]|nr:putative toxin-antitoxin system toxin component, PIN family [Bryobacteraceae bacterium]